MKTKSRGHLQDALAGNPPYYVLITCGEPSADGQMQVEMTYQGDAVLASMLLQDAQLLIEQDEDYLIAE